MTLRSASLPSFGTALSADELPQVRQLHAELVAAARPMDRVPFRHNLRRKRELRIGGAS